MPSPSKQAVPPCSGCKVDGDVSAGVGTGELAKMTEGLGPNAMVTEGAFFICFGDHA